MTQFLLQTIWWVPGYALLGAILTLPWSTGIVRRTGPRPAAYFNLFLTVLSFIHGSAAFILIWGQEPQQLVFHWLQAADLDLTLTLEISPVSLGAMEIVTAISLLAQLFALGYMEKDWALARFYSMMGFFEAALLAIALSDSLLLSYGLLEMLTLSTYFLVGFWYAQPLVVTAARDAFLTKRVGDILLFMGLVALSSYGAGLNFSELADWSETYPLSPLTSALLGLALIAGPTGKCAQFPLNLWLDEAMEGPNPASIMRNSIVVSAGAYVLIKLQPVFTLSPISSDALIIIGSVTAIGTSLMAIAQIDIKRAISHTTSAYLGLVFIAVGLGQVDIALMLLFTHAIAKALMFMSVGSIISTVSDQNMGEMGGLWSRMPATTMAFVVGAASLVVILPLGTFWTVQRWVSGLWQVSPWLFAILLFVNATTAFGFTRVFRLVFLGEPQLKTRRAPEVAWQMALPMVTLTVMTLLSPVVPLRWSLWLSTTTPLANGDTLLIRLALPLLVLSGGVGVVLGATTQLRRGGWVRPTQVSFRFVQDLLAYDFYIERLYDLTVVSAVSVLSRVTAWFDRFIVDGFVNLVGLAAVMGGEGLKYSSSGRSQSYVLTILVGIGLLFLLAMGWTMNWSLL
ncbi:NAD(P)H-quinone oxidoreductase subunit F [Oculatella sp. LEGE 06141]|uniref:NAD(P)H-quinone oxidoreductase subunit F n=1 Tax=Oculatella sp. LEGE 06141 TaxID=1828648 RepID=UPI00187E9E35|nr:NAD(P)H-quinone oxidoreductase subunit F [Oculatella sp. LEGE 06141]MBE9177743.1 NAD(P)H-quinone oxidoreductase subunit F [Oculatella sp. LEGE 06141]